MNEAYRLLYLLTLTLPGPVPDEIRALGELMRARARASERYELTARGRAILEKLKNA